jgi:hypothetical protein
MALKEGPIRSRSASQPSKREPIRSRSHPERVANKKSVRFISPDEGTHMSSWSASYLSKEWALKESVCFVPLFSIGRKGLHYPC